MCKRNKKEAVDTKQTGIVRVDNQKQTDNTSLEMIGEVMNKDTTNKITQTRGRKINRPTITTTESGQSGTTRKPSSGTQSTASTARSSTGTGVARSTASTARSSTGTGAARSTASTAKSSTGTGAARSTASTARSSTGTGAARSTASTARSSTGTGAARSTASTAKSSTGTSAARSTASTAKSSTGTGVARSTASTAKSSTGTGAARSTASTAKSSTGTGAARSTASTAKSSTGAGAARSTASTAKSSTGTGTARSTASTAKSSTGTGAARSTASTTKPKSSAAKAGSPTTDAKSAPKKTKKRKEKRRHNYFLPFLFGVTIAFTVGCAMLCQMILENSDNVLFTTKEDVILEDFIGLTVAEVEKSDQYDMLDVIYEESYNSDVQEGLVYKQSPVSGRTLKEGQQVTLTVSLGTKYVTIDDYSGLTQSEAEEALTATGVYVQVLKNVDSSVAVGSVIRTDPAAGETVESGSTVYLYVSMAEVQTTTTVPDLAGLTASEALSLLTASKLIMGSQTYDYSDLYVVDTIMAQSVAAGTTVSVNSRVSITLSQGVYEEVVYDDTLSDYDWWLQWMTDNNMW